MKSKFLFIAFAMSVLFFTACKKSDPTPTPTPDLAGTTWTGSATIAGIPVTQTYVLNANGTLSGATVSAGGSFPNAGTWSKTPNSSVVYMYFTIVSVSGNYSAQGTLNSAGNKIESGTASNSSNATYTYTYTITKS